jgi:hypothetical protein
MTLISDLENAFNRAFFLSFTKKKLFLVFPVLVLCGILIVFCRSIAFYSGGWIAMSMIFLPIFLSSGILLALGVLVIRIYYHEVKKLKVSYKKIVGASWELIIGTSYLSLPVILVYLLLWIVMGIFLLLKEIPYVGSSVGVLLSFAPFLIILISILLCLMNVGLLFFVTPAVGLKTLKKRHMAKHVFKAIRQNLFSHLLYFIVALLPIAIVVGILSLAAVITGHSYFDSDNIISVSLGWFFIMLPFCAILTPTVIFFFNFAAEAYNNLHKSK